MQVTDKWIRGMLAEDEHLALIGKCHDCGAEIKLLIDANGADYVIDGGYVWKFNGFGPFFKCHECYEKEPKLRNFQPTEVFSRVCGYLRPVKGWNPGKQAEKALRTDYKV